MKDRRKKWIKKERRIKGKKNGKTAKDRNKKRRVKKDTGGGKWWLAGGHILELKNMDDNVLTRKKQINSTRTKSFLMSEIPTIPPKTLWFRTGYHLSSGRLRSKKFPSLNSRPPNTCHIRFASVFGVQESIRWDCILLGILWGNMNVFR